MAHAPGETRQCKFHFECSILRILCLRLSARAGHGRARPRCCAAARALRNGHALASRNAGHSQRHRRRA
eukprot:7217738-Lingulodinium_polyedra.AAC.1